MEILQEIAGVLAQTWSPSYSHAVGKRVASSSLGWIVLGHVCHSLRAMLLDYQALWAKEVCVFPDAQHELLRRAGDVPISLFLDYCACLHAESTAEFITETMSHANYISIYHVISTSFGVDNWLFDSATFAGRNFPALEVFTVNRPYQENRPGFITDKVFKLPPICAPALRKVCFDNFFVPFDGSTLTDLQLVRDIDCQDPLPSSSQFLDMLNSCQKLQLLQLSHWIPDDIAHAVACKPTAFLPSLTTLQVLDCATRCISLWSHLATPKNTERRITMHNIDFQGESEVYLYHIHDIARRDLSFSIHALSIYQARMSTIVISFQVSRPGARGSEWSLMRGVCKQGDFACPLKLTIARFGDSADQCPVRRVLDRLFDAIDAASITHLELGAEYGGYEETRAEYDWLTWRTAVSRLVNVHTLYHGYAPFSALDALKPGEHGPPLLPSLRHLWVRALHSTRWAYPVSTRTPADLVDIVSARKRAGVALAGLRLDMLRFDDDEECTALLRQLREIVPRIECRKRNETCGPFSVWEPTLDGEVINKDEER
jgi:hypothetical protein